ncbi:MAG: phosphate-starvation-inducible PsiE family protein [Methanoregula sp.]|nr:phosphate-starvation-inducible PsiE family protein [Methanoregula sp.]
MIEIVNKFEKLIYASLMIMLMVVLITGVVDLAWLLISSLIEATPWLMETHEMISVLGGFLLVLIGVELLDTIKAYFSENTIHVEIVVLLAIIAVARKVILLDPTGITAFEYGFELIGIGVIVLGLAGGYYLIKKAGITIRPGMENKGKDE